MNNTRSPKQTRLEQVEASVEKKLEQLTTHPLFLKSVATLIDLNSNRILLTKKLLRHLWQQLELPVRKDQEKTLYLVQELQFHVQKLEAELQQLRTQKNAPTTTSVPLRSAKPPLRFSKALKSETQPEII